LLPLAIALPVVIAWFQEPRRQMAASGVDPARAALAGATLVDAMRNYRFFVLAISSVLVGVAMGGAVANFVPILVERDFDRQEAANVAGVIGVTIIVGRIGMGYLIDRYWAPGIAAPVLLAPAIACVILAGAEVSHEYAIIAAVMIGLATGAEADLIAFLTAKYFGLARYARIYGVQYGVFALSAGIAPFLFGVAYDRFQSYQHMLIVAASMCALGAVLMLSLGRYPVAGSDSERGHVSAAPSSNRSR
jgi:MFS family permease